MKQFKLLKDFGDFKAGDVVDEASLDEATIVADLIADGTFEEVVAGADPAIPGGDTTVTGEVVPPGSDVVVPPADAASTGEPVPPADTNATGEQVEKTLVFNGKTVLSKTVRVVEDKEIHHIRLEDGTEMDLTDDEHDAMVQASQAQ